MKVIATAEGYRIIVDDAHEIHVHVRRTGNLAECSWSGEMSERQLRQLRTALLAEGFAYAGLRGELRL